MQTTEPINDQKTLWNGAAGNAWVETQPLLDALFRPFEEMLVQAVTAQAPTHVLDIGCGTGSVSVAVARTLGSGGSCVGIDISEPMTLAAQQRAERAAAAATFICADAQTYPLPPDAFDMLISRFGVMFFQDPVQAFTNLHRAARPGAELRFLSWRGVDDNPFMTEAERAAAPFLPQLPARQPDAPGQFGFARSEYVQQVLNLSGWTHIDLQPVDVACALPEKELTSYFTKLGPLSQILPQADEPTRAQLIHTVRAAFEPYIKEDQVHFTAACWLVTARA